MCLYNAAQSFKLKSSDLYKIQREFDGISSFEGFFAQIRMTIFCLFDWNVANDLFQIGIQ